MLKSTAVLAARLALVIAVPALLPTTVYRLRRAGVVLPRTVRQLPRRTLSRSLALALLLRTLSTLPHLSSLVRRLRRLRTRPTLQSLPPLRHRRRLLP
jgi:hypothetical protein